MFITEGPDRTEAHLPRKKGLSADTLQAYTVPFWPNNPFLSLPFPLSSLCPSLTGLASPENTDNLSSQKKQYCQHGKELDGKLVSDGALNRGLQYSVNWGIKLV